MNNPTNDPAILSEMATPSDWWAGLEDIAEERGYFDALGPRHAALLTDAGDEVLLVSFENAHRVRNRNGRQPLGWRLTAGGDASSLVLISDGESWFRDPEVYGYFDRLADDGFFDDFDRVIFLGAGPCGYAAAAFSVASPGANVIALAPQATLAPERAGWDRRYPAARRMDFTTRYGYAPDMLEAATKAFVIHDPANVQDAMHAALFDREPTEVIRARHFAGTLADIVEDSGALAEIFAAASNGVLTKTRINRALRARRESLPWLRLLLSKLEAEGNPRRIARLCNAVLAERRAPRFRKALDTAERAISGQVDPAQTGAKTEPDPARAPALATL